jgi:hypothetical protein
VIHLARRTPPLPPLSLPSATFVPDDVLNLRTYLTPSCFYASVLRNATYLPPLPQMQHTRPPKPPEHRSIPRDRSPCDLSLTDTMADALSPLTLPMNMPCPNLFRLQINKLVNKLPLKEDIAEGEEDVKYATGRSWHSLTSSTSFPSMHPSSIVVVDVVVHSIVVPTRPRSASMRRPSRMQTHRKMQGAARGVRTSRDDDVQRFERDEKDSSDGRTMTMEAMLCATMAFVLVHVTIVVQFARTPRRHHDCCISRTSQWGVGRRSTHCTRIARRYTKI